MTMTKLQWLLSMVLATAAVGANAADGVGTAATTTATPPPGMSLLTTGTGPRRVTSAQAAVEIGNIVDVTDVVRAVSQARDGVYLSFGAPYPKQTLSIWIPHARWRQMPERLLLLRSVRVVGLVDDERTGPVIRLGRKDLLRLMPVDEAPLSAPSFRTIDERRAFTLALQQRLAINSSDVVDLLDGLATKVEAKTAAPLARTTFFEALRLEEDAGDDAFIRRFAQLTAWREQQPTSTAAQLALTALHVDRAYAIRGANAMIGVRLAPGKQKEFDEAIERARLELGTLSSSTSPVAARCRVAIALGANWPEERFWHVYEQATKAWPDDVELVVLGTTRHAWSGLSDGWQTFAEQQRQRRGGLAGDVLYARFAWRMHELLSHESVRRAKMEWRPIADGLEALIESGEDPRFWKNVYAHLAFEVGDRQRLRAAMDAVDALDDGEHTGWDMDVWVNLDNVATARRLLRDPIVVPRCSDALEGSCVED